MFKRSAGHFGEKPVDDQTTFDATLTMKDEDDLFYACVLKGFFDTSVGFTYILGGIGEVALDLVHKPGQYQIDASRKPVALTRH